MRCSVPGCTRPATIYTIGATAPKPWCLPHGQENGAEQKCERCGRWGVDVEPVRVVNGQLKTKTMRAPATELLLCTRCTETLGVGQPELFA
jgi:hypothetical protein